MWTKTHNQTIEPTGDTRAGYFGGGNPLGRVSPDGSLLTLASVNNEAMKCWIQKPNYDHVDLDNVTLETAISCFADFDWAQVLDERKSGVAGASDCPPGVGYATHPTLCTPGARLLHICPNDLKTVMFHFHRTMPHRILGFIPSFKQEVHTVKEYPFEKVPDLITLLFEGREDAILEIR